MLESEEIITKQAAVIVLAMTGTTFIGGTRLTRRKPVKKGIYQNKTTVVLSKKL